MGRGENTEVGAVLDARRSLAARPRGRGSRWAWSGLQEISEQAREHADRLLASVEDREDLVHLAARLGPRLWRSEPVPASGSQRLKAGLAFRLATLAQGKLGLIGRRRPVLFNHPGLTPVHFECEHLALSSYMERLLGEKLGRKALEEALADAPDPLVLLAGSAPEQALGMADAVGFQMILGHALSRRRLLAICEGLSGRGVQHTQAEKVRRRLAQIITAGSVYHGDPDAVETALTRGPLNSLIGAAGREMAGWLGLPLWTSDQLKAHQNTVTGKIHLSLPGRPRLCGISVKETDELFQFTDGQPFRAACLDRQFRSGMCRKCLAAADRQDDGSLDTLGAAWARSGAENGAYLMLRSPGPSFGAARRVAQTEVIERFAIRLAERLHRLDPVEARSRLRVLPGPPGWQPLLAAEDDGRPLPPVTALAEGISLYSLDGICRDARERGLRGAQAAKRLAELVA